MDAIKQRNLTKLTLYLHLIAILTPPLVWLIGIFLTKVMGVDASSIGGIFGFIAIPLALLISVTSILVSTVISFYLRDYKLIILCVLFIISSFIFIQTEPSGSIYLYFSSATYLALLIYLGHRIRYRNHF